MMFKKGKKDVLPPDETVTYDADHHWIIHEVQYAPPSAVTHASNYPKTDEHMYDEELRTAIEAIGSLDINENGSDSLLNGIRLRAEHRLLLLDEIHHSNVISNIQNRAEAEMQLELQRSELKRAFARLEKIQAEREKLLEAQRQMPSLSEIITGKRHNLS